MDTIWLVGPLGQAIRIRDLKCSLLFSDHKTYLVLDLQVWKLSILLTNGPPPLALGKNYHDIHQIDLSVDKLEVVSHLTI